MPANRPDGPSWTQTLPWKGRIVQPHEKVKAGDYMQIGKSYSRIDADDWMLPHYEPSGGAYGTYWRKAE